MSNTIFVHRSSVGSQTREMRVRLGLTQKELAREVGVPENDIRLLEQDVPVTLDCKRMVLKKLWEKTTINKHI